MSDFVNLLLSNVQVQQFLASLVTSAAKEAGSKAGHWIVDSLVSLVKKYNGCPTVKMAATEKKLEELISEKDGSVSSYGQHYWMDVLTFMFPEREVTIDKLTDGLCDYMANRIYFGLGFEQLLLDVGYKLQSIRYMTHIDGQESRAPHYFDLFGTFEQEYFDNLVVAKVVDATLNSPHDFVNSIPSVVRDINGDPRLRQPLLRDHDIISILLLRGQNSNQLSRLRQTIRIVQTSNDVYLPRLILFTREEFLDILSQEDVSERKKRIVERFQAVRPYRGIG